MTEINETTDLWGDIITEPIRTPLTILREQGAVLEKKTRGILTVKVMTDHAKKDRLDFNPVQVFNTHLPTNTQLNNSFCIESPSLNYSYQLFSVLQPIEIFPCVFYLDEGEKKVARNEEEFTSILGEILQSRRTQKIISALLSQSVGA